MAWRKAISIDVLIKQINTFAPRRSTLSDGTIGDIAHQSRNSDHNPRLLGGSSVVTAVDITHDPRGGCDCNSIVDSLVRSKDPRIKYIIWNRSIISSLEQPWQWRAYHGKNPHDKHFHLSVKSENMLCDSNLPWKIF